jgi:hemolysin activation/secretion protein
MASLSALSRRTSGHFVGLWIALGTLGLMGWGAKAWADAPATQPSEIFYNIDHFSPIFEALPGQPTTDLSFQAKLDAIIGDTQVNLGASQVGYVAPAPNISSATRRIVDFNLEGSSQFSQGAILTIDKAIVAELNRHGYGAVLAVPSPYDIDPQDSSDLRPGNKGTLHILVSVPTAAQVRTVASGDRIPASQPRVDNSKHKRILHNSPVQPTTQGSSGGNSFFNQEAVNDYVDRLNRQPGRRVDVALSAADEPDQYTLDYLVNEVKPWYAYVQESNTGTPITGQWRTRVGFVDNELSGNDDILNIDAVSDFQHSTNVTGSYEFPIGADTPSLGTDRLRARVYGLWDQYTAADLGVLADTFSGNDYAGGAELAYNVLQDHNMFLDVVGGVRYQESQVKSTFGGTSATANYIVPYVGPRVQDYQMTYDYVGSINVEGGITTSSKSEWDQMGRTDPTPDFAILQPDVEGSFYLEPIINHANFEAGRSELAQEVYLSFRGQWALNSRLIPQFQEAAGGYYTVRGYPEAEVAGDTVLLGTAEYRFHLSRALGISPNPTNFKVFGDPFRLLPQQPYQRPDWDFIIRGFIDGGEVLQSRKVPGEFDDTLVGAGAGVELQVRQNLDIRADYGVALDALSGRVSAGSSQVTLIVTLLY